MVSILAPRPAGAATTWAWSLPGEPDATRWLAGQGLAAGGRIALAGCNTVATAQVLLAALRLGVDVVLLNRRLAAPELAGQLARSAAQLLIADPDHPAAALAAHTPLPAAFAGPAGAGGPPAGALVLFTSGSTGAPKAARLPAGALRAAVEAHVAALALTPAAAWACPLPLDHVGGAMCVLRAAAGGCRVHLHDRFDAGALADDLVAVDGASVVPTMLRRLLEARASRPWPSRLRRLLTGGGPLDPALASACAALGLPPSQTYGLTEMGSMATVLDPADWAAHRDSAGRVIPGARVRIRDGRIEVSGPMRFAGYESDGRLVEPAADWHPTGDLGELDRDGFLRVRGRVAELIVSGGENVAAPEVEAVLEAHPAVAEAAVVGLPDPEWGEAVAAAVVLRGAAAEAELAEHCAARLAGFKRPRRWLVVAGLPRTGAGKLRRGELRRLFG